VRDAGQELAALWIRLYDEAHSVTAPPRLLAEVLVAALPPAPPYEPDADRARSLLQGGAVYPRRPAG
jgi:hypothetical protein